MLRNTPKATLSKDNQAPAGQIYAQAALSKNNVWLRQEVKDKDYDRRDLFPKLDQ